MLLMLQRGGGEVPPMNSHCSQWHLTKTLPFLQLTRGLKGGVSDTLRLHLDRKGGREGQVGAGVGGGR